MADESRLARLGATGSEYSPVPVESQSLASPEEVAAFQGSFLRLLERRTAIFTMGDSSSLPKHIAIDLLKSVCFVLGIDLDEPTVPERLLTVDLEAEFRRRLAEVGLKVELAEKLWREACISMPMIPNIALKDTLANIGDFPKSYDYHSMAHDISCSIDYQLCHPVPESLPGVDYILEYLRRLLLEADFLNRFELERCERVLASSCPDHIGLLINLYEPVATNAIGLALIGENPTQLTVTEEARAAIACRLRPLGQAQRVRFMREAAAAVCAALGIEGDEARMYLSDLVPELMPRIELGLSRDDLGGVFVS